MGFKMGFAAGFATLPALVIRAVPALVSTSKERPSVPALQGGLRADGGRVTLKTRLTSRSSHSSFHAYMYYIALASVRMRAWALECELGCENASAFSCQRCRVCFENCVCTPKRAWKIQWQCTIRHLHRSRDAVRATCLPCGCPGSSFG